MSTTQSKLGHAMGAMNWMNPRGASSDVYQNVRLDLIDESDTFRLRQPPYPDLDVLADDVEIDGHACAAVDGLDARQALEVPEVCERAECLAERDVDRLAAATGGGLHRALVGEAAGLERVARLVGHAPEIGRAHV